ADGGLLLLRAPGRPVLLLPEGRGVLARGPRAAGGRAGDAGGGAHRPRRPVRGGAVRRRVRAPRREADPRRLPHAAGGRWVVGRGRSEGRAERGVGGDGSEPKDRSAPRGARPSLLPRDPARPGRAGVREPLPADHRRPHHRRAGRPLDHPRAGLRPRGRADLSARARLAAGRARRRRATDRRPARERADARAVATNAVRYLVPEDAFLADALECMRELVPINRHNVSRVNAEGWLKPAREMRALFAERRDLVTATMEIAEACTFDLGLRRVHFPDFPTPAGRSAAAVLAERCRRGLERRGMKPAREVVDRLEHELALIRRMGYAAYFLTVADIVADIRAMGIRCACRGSAAGSLVCYLTGISDVDPIRHDLVFERFLNPMRDELPDIDVDVESARREDVYDMV